MISVKFHFLSFLYEIYFPFSILIDFFFASAQSDSFYLLKPARVFDGETMHSDWVVLVRENKIENAGAMNFKLSANTRVIELKDATLLPGLIEGHSHFFCIPTMKQVGTTRC